MRAPISVIIPTLNAEDVLKPCLESLMEGLDAGLIRELIVSDGGSTDATGATAQAWGADVVHGSPSRGGQLQRGCAAAKGDWFLILHADTHLAPGWADLTRAHLKTQRAGWFMLAFDGAGIAARLVAGWANLRSQMGLPYGDQGLLVPRGLYETVGGYADQPLMEDVAIARKLRGKLICIPSLAITSAAKYRAQGWTRRGARNLWILASYFAGVAPERLAARYASGSQTSDK